MRIRQHAAPGQYTGVPAARHADGGRRPGDRRGQLQRFVITMRRRHEHAGAGQVAKRVVPRWADSDLVERELDGRDEKEE